MVIIRIKSSSRLSRSWTTLSRKTRDMKCKAFKNYHLFGFTGTPIFAANAGKGKHMELLITPHHRGCNQRAIGAPERIRKIVKYTLEHFDQKTKRNSFYSLKGKRMAGFNAMLAVSSIPMAMKYYTEFKKQLAESYRQFTIATIFSYSANEDAPKMFCKRKALIPMLSTKLPVTSLKVLSKITTLRSIRTLILPLTSFRTTTKTCPCE